MNVPFDGFVDSDFAIFSLPDFGTRMPALKANITPKLRDLGEALTPRLSAAYKQQLYPHVALHLRRSVNAPVATWVAFAKEKRAYKPFVHLRAAISREEVRCSVFVEDYADEKEMFARNLANNAGAISAILGRKPAIRAYTILGVDGKPLRGEALGEDTLRDFGRRLEQVKGQHAVFGISIRRSNRVIQDGPQLVEAIVKAARSLKPIYDLGSGPDVRIPTR